MRRKVVSSAISEKRKFYYLISEPGFFFLQFFVLISLFLKKVITNAFKQLFLS